MDGT
jgi:hypothetical protein